MTRLLTHLRELWATTCAVRAEQARATRIAGAYRIRSADVRYDGQTQPSPVDCAVLIDELLDARHALTQPRAA